MAITGPLNYTLKTLSTYPYSYYTLEAARL